MVASDGKVSAVIMAHFARFCKPGHSMVGVWTMQDSVFLDNRTFQRVWQRVAGSTDAPAAAPPEAYLPICSPSASAPRRLGPRFTQRFTAHPHRAPAAARHRGTGAGAHQKELQVEYFLPRAKLRPARRLPSAYGSAGSSLRLIRAGARLAQRLDTAADTAPSLLRETLTAMAQQDRCHAQSVRNLLRLSAGLKQNTQKMRFFQNGT